MRSKKKNVKGITTKCRVLAKKRVEKGLPGRGGRIWKERQTSNKNVRRSLGVMSRGKEGF